MKLVAFTFLSFFFINGYCQSVTEGNRTVEKKTFVYKTVGKTPIHADLYRAADDRGLKPVIVWIHGGGLINGSRTGLKDEQRNLYIDAGYSVVAIDYRLAPETKIPAIVEDLKDAIQWVRRKSTVLQIDPTRLFVVGHSAGAYLTLVSGYVLKDPPRAIVSFYGYGDIRGDWYSKPDSFYVATRPLVSEETAMKQIADSVVTGSTAATAKGRGDIYMYTRQTGKWPLLVGGRDPQKDEQWFYKYCPLKNVHAGYPPTLLLHGDKDTDVPFGQSVQMDQELTSKKIPHKFIRMKNSEHGFDHANGGLSNPDIKKAFTDVVAFLDSYK